MRRAIGALCTLIVCMQILVGVPLAVCLVFFVISTGGLGPIAVEVHTGQHAALHSATIPPPNLASATLMAPPPNLIPHALPTPHDNPILQSRAEHGSPLAGTVLSQSICPEAEQQLFVAAFEKVAAENADNPQLAPATSEACVVTTHKTPAASDRCEKATQLAIQHLYLMADSDEQTGLFDRADQWRALARGLRAAACPDSPETADSPR